jgi:hypothetical protein
MPTWAQLARRRHAEQREEMKVIVDPWDDVAMLAWEQERFAAGMEAVWLVPLATGSGRPPGVMA